MRPVFVGKAVAPAVNSVDAQARSRFDDTIRRGQRQLAVLIYIHGTLFGVLSFVTAAGRIRECDWIVNPDKLNQIRTVVQH
jgi:hypothetical protein